VLTATSLLEVNLGQGVYAAFTTRVGGQSTGDYAGLNLTSATGDAEENIDAHRDALATECGAPLQGMKQVHGNTVVVSTAGADQPEADGLVASSSGQVLTVLVADCVPVLLADPIARVISAVHAGRVGVLSHVVPKAVDLMVAQGAIPAQIQAAIGPAICGRCYEVPEDMLATARNFLPEIAAQTSWGTPGLDLPGAVKVQLATKDVRQIQHVNYCTLEDRRFYSHRRGQPTGRQAGLVMLRDE